MLLVARPSRNDIAIELSVIIPAFNEAFRLPVALDALRHHVDATTTEIIVVDDGSSDGTADVARRAGDWAKHLVVMSHAENQGKGAAVRTGVGAARGDVIAFIDADNATDLAALGPMVAALGPNIGAVFGSRHAPGSVVTGAPAIRGLMGRVFNHVVKAAAGTKISDTQCGAKVFRAPAARLAFACSAVDGFAFDVEILRRLVAMDFGIVEYPVQWHYVPGTKIKLTTPLRMLRDIVRIRLSRDSGTPSFIDTAYVEPLAAVTDRLLADGLPAEGDPCRIALPFDGATDVEDVLAQQQVSASRSTVRTWPRTAAERMPGGQDWLVHADGELCTASYMPPRASLSRCCSQWRCSPSFGSRSGLSACCAGVGARGSDEDCCYGRRSYGRSRRCCSSLLVVRSPTLITTLSDTSLSHLSFSLVYGVLASGWRFWASEA